MVAGMCDSGVYRKVIFQNKVIGWIDVVVKLKVRLCCFDP